MGATSLNLVFMQGKAVFPGTIYIFAFSVGLITRILSLPKVNIHCLVLRAAVAVYEARLIKAGLINVHPN